MKIAFLFSGQGAQFPGMFKELYDSETVVKNIFDKAAGVLDRSIADIGFSGTQEELNLTHNTQPCVLAADIAAGILLKSRGIVPDAVAGFSLGEYAALACAGAITIEDAFKLIQLRADAMQEAVPVGTGAMAAVIGTDSKVVEEICAQVSEGYVIAANYNSPVQTVISGTTEGIDHAVSKMEEQGLKVMRLAVSAPFHCRLMEPAAKRLEQELKNVSFKNVDLPVFMNVDGKKHQAAAEYPGLLVNQAMNPVQWVETLENMYRDGIDTFIECGPGKALSGFVKKTLKGVSIYRVENKKTLDIVLTALKKD